MKALAWLSLVLTVLVGGDGIYMVASHYKPKDVNNFGLSDGGTVVVAGVFLLIVTIVAFVAASRQKTGKPSVHPNTNVKESR